MSQKTGVMPAHCNETGNLNNAMVFKNPCSLSNNLYKFYTQRHLRKAPAHCLIAQRRQTPVGIKITKLGKVPPIRACARARCEKRSRYLAQHLVQHLAGHLIEHRETRIGGRVWVGNRMVHGAVMA
jgi:hypothetical protein